MNEILICAEIAGVLSLTPEQAAADNPATFAQLIVDYSANNGADSFVELDGQEQGPIFCSGNDIPIAPAQFGGWDMGTDGPHRLVYTALTAGPGRTGSASVGGIGTFTDGRDVGVSPYAAVFAAVPVIEPAQSGCTTARPLLTISGAWRNYGDRRLGMLTLELRSRMGEQEGGGDNAHQTAFDTLFTALLGANGATRAESIANRAAAVAVLQAALAAREKAEVAFYAPAEEAVSADFDGEDYVTTLRLNMAWHFLPVA